MRRPGISVALLPMMAACGSVETPIHDLGGEAFRLDVLLSDDTVVAGESVGYTLALYDRYGAEVEDADIARLDLSTSAEPNLFFTGIELSPTIAGDHLVIATGTYDGWAVEGQAPITVTPAEVFQVDLSLSDYQMRAGGAIPFEVLAIDRFGNDIDPSNIEVTVDSLDVDVATDELRSTVPGLYLAEASLYDISDAEPFVVVPGEPEGVALVLSNTDLELYETATATVDVWDGWGNPTDDPWTITTDRPGDTVVSHRNISFFAEGWHTVTVTVDGTTLTDSVGPFLIDSTGPVLVVNQPSRGDWDTDGYEAVTGNVYDEWSSVDLYVDGNPVSVGTNGDFATSVSPVFGVNVIETLAVDQDGNETDDSRASLSGSFLSYGGKVSSGIEVQLNEGAGGIDTLESIGQGLINSYDLDDLIPWPVYSNSSESCFNPCVFWDCTVCVTWYALTLYAYNPYIGSTTLDIDPRSTGQIRMRLTAYDLSLDWWASATVAEIDFSGSGDISANSIAVEIWATPSVSNGTIHINIDSVSAWSTGFDFQMSGWLDDAIEFFGIDLDGIIEGYMIDAIEDAVRSEVPPVLEDALQDLELTYPFSLDGRTYTLNAKPGGVWVDWYGITLGLESKVTVDQTTHRGSLGFGSLYKPYTPPTWSSAAGMGVAFSGDFLNQVMLAVWRGGVLDIEDDASALGIPSDDISAILPGVTSMTVQTYASLPPVVVPGSSSYEYELQLGDFEVTLFNGPAANNDIIVRAWVTVFAGLDVGITGNASLTANLRDVELYVDVVVPDSNTRGATDTEALLQAIVPMLLPTLTDAIGEIDLPSIQGFGINNIAVSTGGGQNGYVVLTGKLYEQ